MEGELRELFGASWQQGIIEPLAIIADKFEVFNPLFPKEVGKWAVVGLIFMGFETEQNPELFLGDIVLMLTSTAQLNPFKLSDPDGLLVITKFLASVIEIGCHFKEYSKGKQTIDKPPDLVDFRNFVNGLEDPDTPFDL